MGTTLGVMAVQQRPDLYRGLRRDRPDGEPVGQRPHLLRGRSRGRNDGQPGSGGPASGCRTAALRGDVPHETALSHEQAVYPYDHTGNSEGSGQMSENLLISEYTLIDQYTSSGVHGHLRRAVPAVAGCGLPEDSHRVRGADVLRSGAHEADGRAQPFADWYPMIQAPVKDMVVFDSSGHRPLWEQPDEFVDYMVGTVLAQTSS